MYIKNNCLWIRQLAGLLAGLFFFLCIGGTAFAKEESEGRVLRVAFPELSGISEIDQYGRHKGLLVDYLNEIAKYTGWEYEYVEVSDEELIPNFEEGQYDLMGGSFYAPGFEEYFAYPEYNTGRSRAVLLCRRDDESLRGYDVTSLNGKTIGVYERAAEKIRHLKEFLASNDLECELRYYTVEDMGEDGNLYRQLKGGEVDMLLGNEHEIGGEFRMVASFQAQPYYIVTNVGNTEILEGLNMALGYILESTPNFAEEVYNNNFPDIKLADIQLNEEEIQYIAKKKTVSVAVPKSWHPLYCIGNSGDHHQGLLPELLAEISEFTGLNFTWVYTETYADAIRSVIQGEADILGSYLGEEEQAFADGLVLAQPYVSLGNIVLKNKSVSYPGKDLTCGVLNGHRIPDDFESEEVVGFDTIQEMMSAVNGGEVDFIYGASAMLEQEMQNHRYLNVVPVTQASDSSEVSFAMARPIEPELLTTLNKTIVNLSTDKKNDMLNRNLVSVGYTNLTFQELIYANPVAFIAIFGGALFIIMCGILMVIRSRMKNSLMQSRVEAAEAKSLAKSEFLARMSHEIRTPMNAITGLADLACMEPGIPQEVERKLQKIRSSSRYLLALINDILDMSRIENGKMEIEQADFSLIRLLEELTGMMSVQAEEKALLFRREIQIRNEWIVGDAVRLRQVLTNLLSNAIKFTAAGGMVLLDIRETDCDGTSAVYCFRVKDTGIGISREDQEKIFSSFEQLRTAASNSAGTGLGLPISRNIARLMGGDLEVASEPGKGAEFYMTLRFPLGTGAALWSEGNDAEERSLEGMRILLAEDNNLNAEIAQELLEMQGIEVCRAVDGQEAVDLFFNSAPGEFGLILMDIRMPVKDGHEAAREIRGSGRPDADVPIIAMTANSFKEDEEAAMKAGMNGFVPKPVDINYLLSVLRKEM